MLTELDKNNIRYIHRAVSFCNSDSPEQIRSLNATRFAMIDIVYKIHEEMYKPQISARTLEEKIAVLENSDFCMEIVEPVIQYFKGIKNGNFAENKSDLIKAMRLYEFCLPNYCNSFCLYFNKYRFPKRMEGIVYTFLNSIGEFCVLKTAMLARNMLCYYLNYLLQGNIQTENADGTIRTMSESEQIEFLQECNAPEALIFICNEVRYIANDLLHRTQNEIRGNGRKKYIRLVVMGLALICVMPLNRDSECISNINNIIGTDQSEDYEMNNESELIYLAMRLENVIIKYKPDVDTKNLGIEASEIIGQALILGKRTSHIPEWNNSIVPATAAAVRYMIEEICFSAILTNQSPVFVKEWLEDPDSDSSTVAIIDNARLTWITQTVFHMLRMDFINVNAHKKNDLTKELDWRTLQDIVPLIEYAFTRQNAPVISFPSNNDSSYANNVSLINGTRLSYTKQLSHRYQQLGLSELKYDTSEYRKSINNINKKSEYVPGRAFGVICMILQIILMFAVCIGSYSVIVSFYDKNGSVSFILFLACLLFVLGGMAYATYVWLVKE